MWSAYLAIQGSLAGDDPEGLGQALESARLAIGRELDTKSLDAAARAAWERDHLRMSSSLGRVAESGLSLVEQRVRFETFSGAVDLAMQHFGSAIDGPVYRIHCPMAFDNSGADWLQGDQTVSNPYFGAAMLRCGEVTAELWPGNQGAAKEVGGAPNPGEQPNAPSTGTEPGVSPPGKGPAAPDPVRPPASQPAAKPNPQAKQPTSQPAVEPTPQTGKVVPESAPLVPVFGKQLDGVWTSYLAIQESLAADDLVALRVAIGTAEEALGVEFHLAELSPKQRVQWPLDSAALGTALAELERAALSLDKSRAPFERLSHAMAQTVLDFQLMLSGPVYSVHCPMALGNQGADWLQADQRVNNPYFGAAMLRCGSVQQTLIPGEQPK